MEKRLAKENIVDNMEISISRVLKEMNGKHELVNVTNEKGDLVFAFSEKISRKAKSFVKQFKKAPGTGKLSAVEIAISSFNNEQFDDFIKKGYRDVCVIETKRNYLIFFTKS